MRIDFEDKIVLITGATRGIGKQLASDFENLGADLILTGTNKDQIREMNDHFIQKKIDHRIRYYCVDFLDKDSLINFIHELGTYERIDVCINNAGINRIDHIHDASLSDWDRIVDVNLKAPFAILKEVSQTMIRNHYGRIVNISSIYGVISREKRAMYSSSKSGIIGMTKGAALDLAEHNILVNSVSPGFVLTDLTKSILSQSEIEQLTINIPVKRMATPDDISKVILFLASDMNSYITGQNITVDGGYVIT